MIDNSKLTKHSGGTSNVGHLHPPTSDPGHSPPLFCLLAGLLHILLDPQSESEDLPFEIVLQIFNHRFELNGEATLSSLWVDQGALAFRRASPLVYYLIHQRPFLPIQYTRYKCRVRVKFIYFQSILLDLHRIEWSVLLFCRQPYQTQNMCSGNVNPQV